MSTHVQVLSGLAGSPELWDGVVDRARVSAPGTTITVEDVPWQAHGPWAHPGWDPADTLAGLVRDEAIVVAHSFAATLALGHLCRPGVTRPSGAVLVSPFFRPDHTNFTWASLEHFLLRFHEFLETGLVARSSRQIDPAIRAGMAMTVRDLTGPYGWMAFMSAYLSTPSFNLSGARLPVVVVYGTEDEVAPPEDATMLARLLPDAELLPVRGADHFPMTSHPDLITAAISAVLSRAGARPAPAQLVTTTRSRP